MTYYFETYGCQMNIAESASIENIFIARGWKRAQDAATCDVVVINSCSIRESAECRIRGRLGYFLGQKRSRGKKPIIIFTGCMAQRLKGEIARDFPFIDYTVGNFEKDKFTSIIESLENTLCNNPNGLMSNSDVGVFDKNSESVATNAKEDEYHFFKTSYEQGIKSQFVPIMHGCNNFCTYCVVPYLRGREVSRNISDILSELDYLAQKDTKEIVLLGQNVNSYNYGEYNFAKLLDAITNHLQKTNSPIKWVRFLSSHPKDLSPSVISVMKGNALIAPALHLPAQSGSNRILSLMNRRYTREDYLQLVDTIKREIPNISLSSDIMVGFPGETDEDFNETLSLMDAVKYTSAMMYYYNERPGTKAVLMEQLPIDLRKARLERVISNQLLHTQFRMKEHLGDVLDVLVEKVSRDDKDFLLGKTPFDTKVAFKGDSTLIGSFVKVKISALNGNTYNGEIV